MTQTSLATCPGDSNLRFRWQVHETILLVLVVLEWVWFRSQAPRFGSWDNTFDIIRHSTELGLIALAMTPVILTGGIDLSVGSLLGLCAIVLGKLWRDGHCPIWVAAGVALTAGAAAGGSNALLITRLDLPPLIVTLATYSLFRGFAEALTRGVDTFTGFPENYLRLGQGEFLDIPSQVPVVIVVLIVCWAAVHKTTIGRRWRAIGFSPEGARFAAISVKKYTGTTYLITGIASALAAIIYIARLGQAKADAGTGYELLAITAVVLGGTSIFGGRGSVHGTLLGVAALAILNNGLVHARLPREASGIFTGVLLIAALALPRLRALLSSGLLQRVRPWAPIRASKVRA